MTNLELAQLKKDIETANQKRADYKAVVAEQEAAVGNAGEIKKADRSFKHVGDRF